MKHSGSRLFLTLAVIVFFVVSCAGLHAETLKPAELSRTINVEDINIDLPIADGFVEISTALPAARQVFETFVPEENRLDGLYLLQNDLIKLRQAQKPDYDSYIMVQSARGVKDYTAEDFARAKQEMRTRMQEALEEAREDIDAKLGEAVKSVETQDADMSVSEAEVMMLEVGKMKNLGVFQENQSVISTAQLVNFGRADDGSDTKDRIVAVATTYARIKSRLLYIYVYQTYKGANDLGWVRSNTMDYTKQLLALNDTAAGHSVANFVPVTKMAVTGLFILAFVIGAVVLIGFSKSRKKNA